MYVLVFKKNNKFFQEKVIKITKSIFEVIGPVVERTIDLTYVRRFFKENKSLRYLCIHLVFYIT
jgi:hypothetical protein